MVEFLSVFSSVMFLIWAACGIASMFRRNKPVEIHVTGHIKVPRRQDVVVIHTSDGPRQAYEPDIADLQQPGYQRWGRENLN